MSITSSKGLANQPGENNCFLNCAVQALWHIDVFRESLRLLSGHRCTGPACIFCALKVTFTQLSYSGQRTLMPNILRKALAESFSTEQRFQLGDMDDSAECLDTILQRLHLHLCSSEDPETTCQAPHCISHSKFGMRLLESLVCPGCGSAESPDRAGVERYVQLIHYVVTDALVSELRQSRTSKPRAPADRLSFAELVERAGAGDPRDCPSCRNRSARLRRQLLSVPPVVILGLVWHSQQPGVSFLADVVESIDTDLQPGHLFDHTATTKNTSALLLTGMICYYGRHYSAFCRNNWGEWLFFDDDVVRPMGQHWRSVVHRCVRGGFQPLLLIYADPDAQPVDVETALANTVRVSPTQFRREAAETAAASTSSGSLGRSRVCPNATPECGGADTAMREGDMAAESHSRSSSLSEDTLLAGGNPHLHRRLSSSIPTPPPPPEFANDDIAPPAASVSSAVEFRRQGSYISAVTERPAPSKSIRRSDSLDSAIVSPPNSPGSSPVHRRPSNSSSPPEGHKYIARQTVETILSLQRQQAAYRRRAATGTAAPHDSTLVSNFGTLPKRRPPPLSMPPPPPPPKPQASPASAVQSPGVNRRPMRVLPGGDHVDGRHWQFQRSAPPHASEQGQAAAASGVDGQRPQPTTKPQIPAKPQFIPGRDQSQRPPPVRPPMLPQPEQQPPLHQQLQAQLDLRLSQQQSAEQLRQVPRVAEQKNRCYLPAAQTVHLSSSHQLPNASSGVDMEVTTKPAKDISKKIVGACPTCGIADSWTIDAGICIRCNVKLPPRSTQPLKSALSAAPDRSTSISSADSCFSANSTSSTTSAGKPRKKKSVHFNEATLGPVERPHVLGSYPAASAGAELCQLCQQRAISMEGGPAYCSVCQVYLSRFVSQAR